MRVGDVVPFLLSSGGTSTLARFLSARGNLDLLGFSWLRVAGRQATSHSLTHPYSSQALAGIWQATTAQVQLANVGPAPPSQQRGQGNPCGDKEASGVEKEARRTLTDRAALSVPCGVVPQRRVGPYNLTVCAMSGPLGASRLESPIKPL